MQSSKKLKGYESNDENKSKNHKNSITPLRFKSFDSKFNGLELKLYV